jgi:predicted ester cyclase
MFRKSVVILGLVVVLGLTWALPQLSPAKSEVNQVEQNKLIVQDVIRDLWNGENLDAVGSFYAERFYTHCPDKRVTTLWTPADWKRITFENLHGQYSDLAITVNYVVAEGDRVIIDFTARGTHDGEVTVDLSVSEPQAGVHSYRNIHTIPATGTRDVWDGVLMYRLEDGKIVEEWWYWNGAVAYR